jgi:hypothetical protein
MTLTIHIDDREYFKWVEQWKREIQYEIDHPEESRRFQEAGLAELERIEADLEAELAAVPEQNMVHELLNDIRKTKALLLAELAKPTTPVRQRKPRKVAPRRPQRLAAQKSS